MTRDYVELVALIVCIGAVLYLAAAIIEERR